MNTAAKIVLGIIVIFFIAKTCGRSDSSSSRSSERSQVAKNWQKSPVDELIKQMNGEQNFSIILFDMDADEASNKYRHQYQILIERPDTVLEKKTDWKNVSETFFSQHINNMGMEIASKKNGTVTKQAVPAGYNHYVGNEKYGHWVDRGGSSFWEFYGKYALISSVFNMMTYPRSHWYDYRQGGYYGGSRGYYGPGGSSYYGTKNYTSSSRGKSSTWGSKSTSFKDKVRSKVSRSSSKSSRFSNTRKSSTKSYNRTKRSSSRYKSSRSTRSRSGGFGK